MMRSVLSARARLEPARDPLPYSVTLFRLDRGARGEIDLTLE
jgi:hypothetical protein